MIYSGGGGFRGRDLKSSEDAGPVVYLEAAAVQGEVSIPQVKSRGIKAGD